MNIYFIYMKIVKGKSIDCISKLHKMAMSVCCIHADALVFGECKIFYNVFKCGSGSSLSLSWS
jgi:hypothetical protein